MKGGRGGEKGEDVLPYRAGLIWGLSPQLLRGGVAASQQADLSRCDSQTRVLLSTVGELPTTAASRSKPRLYLQNGFLPTLCLRLTRVGLFPGLVGETVE